MKLSALAFLLGPSVVVLGLAVVVFGFPFVDKGICPVLTIGVPGLGVVEGPIGLDVSSVKDGLLGVEVFGFSVVDVDNGVSSILLVGVETASTEDVGLGVCFSPGVVKPFSVLIIGVVVGGF